MGPKVEPNHGSAPQTAAKTLSLIGDAKLKQLYATMLRCRLLDQSLARIAAAGKSKRPRSVGHEAALVGAALDLRRDDWLLPQQRAAVAALLRGRPLSAALASARSALSQAAQTSPLQPSHIPPLGNIVPPAESLTAQLNIAIGLALAAQSRQKGQIAMAFCEDEAADSTEIPQALRFAALRRLPLLLLALPPISRPDKAAASSKQRRPAALVSQSRASGIPVIPVDHADVVAMCRVAFESIHKARRDGGPTLIEAAIWPLPAKPDQAPSLAAADPIDRMEAYLARKGLFADRWRRRIVERGETEIAAAHADLRR